MTWQQFSAVLRRFPEKDQREIERAYKLGEKMHAGQKRKSGEPYFTHPVTVARMLIDLWADKQTIIAALLHDTVEDTPLTLDEIEMEFGPSVRALVEGVTKLSREELGGRPTLDEQIETLRKIFNLMQEDVRIMVIKLIDRLHNMQTTQFLSPERREALARETLLIYARIADRLCMYDLSQELEALCMGILEPEVFAKLSTAKKESDKKAEQVALTMRSELHVKHGDVLRAVEVLPEQKSWHRLRQQLEAEGAAITGVTGITVVFVCPDIDTCYRILGLLHQQWRRETLSFQDFINSPQINGYRGLHTTVILSNGTRIRCKIRTQEMHRYALQGIATLCFENAGKDILEYLPWARRISPLTEDTKDRSREFWDSLQNDILGESIVLHGQGDETVHLPLGSTALDGAFYLFKDLALRVSSIKVNGKDASFRTALKHGDSLHVTLSDTQTVQREWLEWTETGLATANIRSALALSAPEESMLHGKSLLQHLMHQHKLGFLEEFEPAMLIERLRPLGLVSLDELYLSIAQGRLSAEEAFAALFESKKQQAVRRPTSIRYAIPMEDVQTMDSVNAIHRSHGDHLNDIRYHRGMQGQLGSVSVYGQFTSEEADNLARQLKSAGAIGLQIQRGRLALLIPSIACMLLLWGLDPLLAKFFLLQGVHPMSFGLIRAVSVFLLSLATLYWTRQESRLSRISFTSPTLWLSGIAFFFVSVLTYFALDAGSPVLYNTIFRSNSFFISLPDLLHSPSPLAAITATALTVGGMVMLGTLAVPGYALLLSLAVLFFFSVYTSASNRFQKSARVLARLPQFFTVTSGVAALGALIAYLALPAPLPSPQFGMVIAGYSIVFVGMPYLLFYTLRREVGYAAVTPWNHLLLVVTFVAQWFTLGIDNVEAMLVGALLLTAGSLIASRTMRQSE